MSKLPRPFLKWAGGKSRLLPQYVPYFPKSFNAYYEPFLGGGSVFFHLQPQRAVLRDINAELINAYCCVQKNVTKLIKLLQQHAVNHNQEYYYDIRSQQFNSNLERAARFIYLNKTCYNGLYRENSRGQFNVPIGRYKNPQICPEQLLIAASAHLQNACIEVGNFDLVLSEANADDLVYFDPPYHPISATSNFTAYTRYAFGEAEQLWLRDTFSKLAYKGVKVMLSNSDCEFIRELYKDFAIVPIAANRAINSKADQRGKISELLIVSYAGDNL